MATIKRVLDPNHVEIQFKVRHLMITTVTGSFGKFDASFETTDDNLEAAKVNFSAEVDSITTNNEQRDAHLKNADFFEAAKHPATTCVTTKLESVSGENYMLTGDLSFPGATKYVKMSVEY